MYSSLPLVCNDLMSGTGYLFYSMVVSFQYFNNEQFEADQYDKYLQKYELASLKTSTSLALLNWGQNAIFSIGLSAMMILATREIIAGVS